jgi:uncharacterized membrane protein
VNLPDTLLGEAWCWAAWAVWLPCFAFFILRAPWRGLLDGDRFSVWLGMIVVLTLLWSMQAGVKPGLSLHLLGGAVFVLCFGPALAFVGMNAVLAGIMLNGGVTAMAFAINALMMAGLPVFVVTAICQFCRRFFPSNFFVYIFIQSFFGAIVMVLVVGFSATIFLFLAGVYPWEYLIDEYFPYFMLLGFAEGWLSGMVMTLFVVYRPAWVVTFDDRRYLINK